MSSVVVVDDSFSARRALETILRSAGHEVKSFPAIEPALRSIEETPPELIFCDLVLHGEDGIEMWQALQSTPQRDDTGFVLVSGLVDDRVRARCAQEGIHWILAKPFSVDTVNDLLQSVLAGVGGDGAETTVVDDRSADPGMAGSLDRMPPMVGDLLEVLAGVGGARDIAVLSASGEILSKTSSVSLELRSWFTEAWSLLPRGEAASGRSVWLEKEGGVHLAVSLGDGLLLLGILDDFSSVGAVRFFVRRVLARNAENQSDARAGTPAPTTSTPN